MGKPLLLHAICCATLLGCASEQETGSADASQAANKITCLVGGTTLVATGDQVQVASLGAKNGLLNLALGLVINKDGEQLSVSTGLMWLPMQAGSYSFPSSDAAGYNQGKYERQNQDGKLIKEYSGGNYWLFYARDPKDPAVKLQISFSKMEKVPDDLPNFVRIRMVGNFKFNAAYAPQKNGNFSDECTTEAVRRSITNASRSGPVFPQYNAQVCGAEQLAVSGSFDVMGKFLTM